MKNKKNENDATLSLNKTGPVPRLTDPGLWSRIWEAHAPLLGDKAYRTRLQDEAGIQAAEHDDLIREYLRFAYLSWTTPDGATPSKAVDEAWHTHILFTRSYIGFCEAARGSYLHHQPGDGGDEDKARFREAYHRTLDRYLAEFGTPPARWWPDERTVRAAPEAAVKAQPGTSYLAEKAVAAGVVFGLPVTIVGGTGFAIAGPGTFFFSTCLAIGCAIGALGALPVILSRGSIWAGGSGRNSGSSGSSCTSTLGACSGSSCSSGCGGGGGGCG